MAENPSSHQPQEENPPPDSKRQKMSTTSNSSDDDEANTPAIPKTPKYKRRKVAIFFAYCGVGYQGMQKNPGAKTIEGDLEEALYRSGAVPEAERGQPRRYDWARSARTDKGVSAVGQVVSGKFYVDPPGFVERLNSNLSPQIRVFGYKRVTPSFSAKKFCDRRRYVYLIPVFALDPSCHRDRESVLASVGSGNELVKCLECSERGRKVFGVMGKCGFESKCGEVGSDILSNSGSALDERGSLASSDKDNETEKNSSVETGAVGAEKMDDDKAVSVDANVIVENKIEISSSEKVNDDDDAGCENTIRSGTEELVENGGEAIEKTKEENLECENGVDHAKLKEEKSEFRYGEEEKARLNRILKYYEGTHNFHNFTTRTKAEDPSAKRYILSFNANTVMNLDGVDFVKCEVVGQSFMLHQIRKMIGLAVAIMRNFCPELIFETAFQQKVNINVPTAPEIGLYLDECFFPSYNRKWEDTHEEVSMKDYAEEAEVFKVKYIYTHVASSEHKDGSVALWLHSLNYRNYPDLRYGVENAPVADVEHNEITTTNENGLTSEEKHIEITSTDENGMISEEKQSEITNTDENGLFSEEKQREMTKTDE